MRSRSTIRAAVGFVAALAGLSCGDSTGPSPLTEYIARITGSGLTATVQRGMPPEAGVFNTPQVFAPGTWITGGSAEVQLHAAGQEFSRVLVQVQGQPDYYQITLPSPVQSIALVVTLEQEITENNLTFVFGLGNTGAVSYQSHPLSVWHVGTGDVQVSVSWDVDSDVDLHLVEPGGEEIYYGNTTSATGGELDLDSNPACAIDGVRNENITWPTSAPPKGQYTVRLDYYDECQESETRYVVTVRRQGHPVQTFSGTFTGAGDGGGQGSGVVITQFAY